MEDEVLFVVTPESVMKTVREDTDGIIDVGQVSFTADGTGLRFMDWRRQVVMDAYLNNYGSWRVLSWIISDDGTSDFGWDFNEGVSKKEFDFIAAVCLSEGKEPDTIINVTPEESAAEDPFSFIWWMEEVLRDTKLQYVLRDLYSRVDEVEVAFAGGAVPFQAEGTLYGYGFYFRYRHGTATLSVGGDDIVLSPMWYAGEEYGDVLDGTLNITEFTYLFALLVTKLERCNFLYTFTRKGAKKASILEIPMGEGAKPFAMLEQFHGRGWTVEEARESAADTDLAKKYANVTADMLVTEDEDIRPFPEVDPLFIVSELPECPVPSIYLDEDDA